MRVLFHTAQPVPAEYRSNFFHLYFDIAWYGVLAASAMAFVSVYAARQGANALQIGLLGAGPAAMNLLFTLPVGHWLEGQKLSSAVFWTAVLHRLFYLLWVPLPMWLAPQVQVWVLIGSTLLMSIPGTALAVGFNALFAEAVPPAWRGHVAGIRNALLAIAYILTSLLCGQILVRLPFPTGYQVVFGIGFVGAAMSCFHLRFVTGCSRATVQARTGPGLGDLATPGWNRLLADGLRPGAALRFLIRRQALSLLRAGDLPRSFVKLIAVLFSFHLAINMAIPLFPLHWVRQLHLSDREIGIGMAIFYGSVFLGSTQLARVVGRWGNQRATAVGGMLMSSYPVFMALARDWRLFMVGSAVGGLGWSLVGGALTNYLLEKIPEEHRPTYLAWYNLALNAALLSGSLLGPLIGGWIGVRIALAVIAVFRLLAALAIWKE